MARQQITWEDFGPFLQRHRIRQGVSQDQLAQLLGCHRTHIWRLEHGQRRPSKMLLHLLGRSGLFSSESAHDLKLFESMIEHHVEALVVGDSSDEFVTERALGVLVHKAGAS